MNPRGNKAAAWRPRDAKPAFDSSRYTPAALGLAMRGWQSLCDEERDSVSAAALVLHALSVEGAPPAILGDIARVVEDEVRHVAVCEDVIKSLGGVPTATALRPRATLGVGAPRVALARTLVAGFVAGEPLSAASFAMGRSRATEPLIHWAYTELLRDEIRHGAAGARAATWVMAPLAASVRQSLWPDCVFEMERFESVAAGEDPAALDTDETLKACLSLGMLSRADVQDAIIAAIPRWILPRLADLGVLPEMNPPRI